MGRERESDSEREREREREGGVVNAEKFSEDYTQG